MFAIDCSSFGLKSSVAHAKARMQVKKSSQTAKICPIKPMSHTVVLHLVFLLLVFCASACDDTGEEQEPCVPNCANRSCGSDDCGGFCGVCQEGFACSEFACVSTCVPQCKGRECGDDGCGGICGECDAGFVCAEGFQQCKSLKPMVYGSVVYEARLPEFTVDQGYKLSKTEYLPAAGLVIRLRDKDGAILGSAVLGEKGEFSILASRAILKSDWLSISPHWPDTQSPKLILLKAAVKGSPSLWTWSFALDEWGQSYDLGRVGEMKVSRAEGSGALYAYQYLQRAMQDYAQYRYDGQSKDLKALAVLWAPGVSWSCGACFVKLAPQVLDGKELAPSSMYIGGASNDESVWGYPTLMHEFGHYIAAYTRDNSPGGEHYFGELSRPTLAWSEGWATFYALLTLSLWENSPQSHYWRILAKSSFWLDYEILDGPVPILSPSLNHADGIKQYLDEAWVTLLLWKLWNKGQLREQNPSFEWQSLLDALHSERYIKKNRGYFGADFVDYLDALVCKAPSTESAVQQLVQDNTFPYDTPPLCE